MTYYRKKKWSYFATKYTLLYANCLFCIRTIYSKYFAFHFLIRGIRMNIPILIAVEKGHIRGRKMVLFD